MKKTKSRKDPEVLALLKEWLNKPGNTQAKLAMDLGYQTTNAISTWLSRKKIPTYQRLNILRVIQDA